MSMDAIAERLIAELIEPYDLLTHQQSVNVPVGIVAMPKDGVDAVQLLRRSNLALQNARAAGIGNWAVFHPEIGKVADYRQWIEAELQRRLRTRRLRPVLPAADRSGKGNIVGYEALIRWRHPERGMIPPMDFIPIAEETGMIVPDRRMGAAQGLQRRAASA